MPGETRTVRLAALSRSFAVPEDFVHWAHNSNTLPDGTLIISELAPPLPVPSLYYGVPWGAELWELIRKRPGANTPADELRTIFRRYVLMHM